MASLRTNVDQGIRLHTALYFAAPAVGGGECGGTRTFTLGTMSFRGELTKNKCEVLNYRGYGMSSLCPAGKAGKTFRLCGAPSRKYMLTFGG